MRRLLILNAFFGVAVLTVTFLTSGCLKDRWITDMPIEGASAGSQAGLTLALPPMRKDGARAWTQNCMRCHNVRDPQERSDREWEVIVHHMRVRANLTAEEHRLILEFLKAAN